MGSTSFILFWTYFNLLVVLRYVVDVIHLFQPKLTSFAHNKALSTHKWKRSIFGTWKWTAFLECCTNCTRNFMMRTKASLYMMIRRTTKTCWITKWKTGHFFGKRGNFYPTHGFLSSLSRVFVCLFLFSLLLSFVFRSSDFWRGAATCRVSFSLGRFRFSSILQFFFVLSFLLFCLPHPPAFHGLCDRGSQLTFSLRGR